MNEWTAPYMGVRHLTITARYETYTATVSDYGRFAIAYIYKHGSSEQYTYGPRTFFKGECIEQYNFIPGCDNPVRSAVQWAQRWIPQ